MRGVVWAVAVPPAPFRVRRREGVPQIEMVDRRRVPESRHAVGRVNLQPGVVAVLDGDIERVNA